MAHVHYKLKWVIKKANLNYFIISGLVLQTKGGRDSGKPVSIQPYL